MNTYSSVCQVRLEMFQLKACQHFVSFTVIGWRWLKSWDTYIVAFDISSFPFDKTVLNMLKFIHAWKPGIISVLLHQTNSRQMYKLGSLTHRDRGKHYNAAAWWCCQRLVNLTGWLDSPSFSHGFRQTTSCCSCFWRYLDFAMCDVQFLFLSSWIGIFEGVEPCHTPTVGLCMSVRHHPSNPCTSKKIFKGATCRNFNEFGLQKKGNKRQTPQKHMFPHHPDKLRDTYLTLLKVHLWRSNFAGNVRKVNEIQKPSTIRQYK